MNKVDINELAQAVALKAGLTSEEALKLLEAFAQVIVEELEKGNRVSVGGLGNFVLSRHHAREGINPTTKEKVQIPTTTVMHFRPAKELKNALR